ncbi:MAG: DUF72 domain-containing protein [Candidatus Thorarchaeota archaeon]
MSVLRSRVSLRRGLHIGTCGWSYPEWKGIFYSSGRTMLQQYFTYFDVAEINSTFYGPLRQSIVHYLMATLSGTKHFTAKIPHRVTHNNRLDLRTEAGKILSDFFEKMKPMSKRLGVFLIQLPPWELSTFGDLETFFSALDSDYRYAIEFRHESWIRSRVWRLLEDYQIAHVIVDEPRLPVNMRVTTDFVYVRLHGHGSNPWYNYCYSDTELHEWSDRLNVLADENEYVYTFFNNHFYGYGPTNALQILEMLNRISPIQKNKLERMLPQLAKNQTTLDEFLCQNL